MRAARASETTCGTSPFSDNILGALMPLSSVDACSAMLAIEHSNLNDSSVIPQFGQYPPLLITPLLNDTGDDPAMGVAAYRALLHAGATALVGAGRRSSVTGLVSLLGAHNALPMVGYAASSATLSDSGSDGLYTSFARVFPTDRVTASVFVPLMQVFGWKHFSILHVSDIYGRSYTETLVAAARRADVAVMSQGAFASGDRDAAVLAVQQLKDMNERGTGANIIVLVAHSTEMEAVFSEADRQGMLKWPYVWITSDGVSTAVANKFPVELARKLAGILQLHTSPEALPGFARYQAAWQRLTPADCARLVPVIGELDQSAFEGRADIFGAYAYDAAAAAALAMRAVAANRSTSPSNAATYGARLNEAIRSQDFSGATGRVSFQPGLGDRAPGEQELVLFNWLWGDGVLTSEMSVSVKLSDNLAAAGTSLLEQHRANGTMFKTILSNDREITWLGGERKAWWIPGGSLGGDVPRDLIQVAIENEASSIASSNAERRRLSIGFGVAVANILLLAIFLFVRVRFAKCFRKKILLVSGSDGSIAPNVTFITDIEGNWEFFERYVTQCEALSFPSGHPEFAKDGAADLVLAEGWRFIHGGDTCDKGGVVGGSIRVVNTLCKLKVSTK